MKFKCFQVHDLACKLACMLPLFAERREKKKKKKKILNHTYFIVWRPRKGKPSKLSLIQLFGLDEP